MVDASGVLFARVGRVSPRTWAGAERPAAATGAPARSPALDALALLFALLLALWPHWIWMARRLTDGSDEPWGVLALATVLVLVARGWRRLEPPAPRVLLASATLAVAAAVARAWLPPIAAAALAMTALAVFLTRARRDQAGAPLVALLLLGLPLIASLQFYFGYPLRLATATLAAPLLRAFGFAVQASGAALAYDGHLVLVDPPCAGIGMLWVGAYTAALLSHLKRASTRRTMANGLLAALCVFAANVARNGALFFPEALELGWPAWAHAAIGLAAFALALVPIVAFIHHAPRAPARWPVSPQRHHRRPA
jgi:exosortase/archaeosortase family protein